MVPVELQQFEIKIGERCTLKTIDMKFEEGSSTIILGPTGTGKSVLLKTIAGVLPLSVFKFKGNLKINGFDAYTNGVKAKNKVWKKIALSGLSFIPAETAMVLNPSLTMEQNLNSIAPGCKELVTSRLKQYFDIDFENFAKSYPDEVSGGQIQRITLMILLSRKGSLILLDEPTVNLDRDLRNKFAIFLNQEILNDKTKTMIMVSHDINFVSKLHYTDLCFLRDGDIELNYNLTGESDGKQKEAFTEVETPDKIVMEDVNQTYEKRTILADRIFTAFNHLNLTLNQNVIYGITGPSGCGKTSAVKAILRLLNGTTGKITLKGNDLVKLKPVENGVDPKAFKPLRKKLCIVQQDSRFSFIPDLKIRDSLKQILKCHDDVTIERVIEKMAEVGLAESNLDRYPQSLSSGEIKRLDIILALCFNPEVLVLDEPFAHIDQETRMTIMQVIKKHLAENKLFLIIITHEDFDLEYFVQKDYEFSTLLPKQEECTCNA